MADKDEDYSVETADAGAAMFKPIQTSTLKKGSYILIKGRPCKVDAISTSKPGKHGSAKCHIVAIDIFTNKKMEEISPSHQKVDSPEVIRLEYALHDISDGFLVLWDENGCCQKEDVRVPDGELGTKIQKMHEDGIDVIITVLSAMGTEMVIDVKTDK